MRRVLAWLLRKTFGVDLDEGARWRRDALLRDGWNAYIKCTTWSLGRGPLAIPTMGLDPAGYGCDRTVYMPGAAVEGSE